MPVSVCNCPEIWMHYRIQHIHFAHSLNCITKIQTGIKDLINHKCVAKVRFYLSITENIVYFLH